MFGYIYMTTNTVNNMKYIGQRRYRDNKSATEDGYLGSGTLLRKAIDEFGKDNFTKTVLEECETREELNAAEIRYIAQYNAVYSKEFYNLAAGGEGQIDPSPELREKLRIAATGVKDSEETKRKKSEAHKGERNYLYGKHPSDEARQHMSEAQKKRFARGDKNPWTGHVYTEEEKARISKKLTGRKVPREQAEKAARTHWIEIYCSTNDMLYPSIQHASAATGVDGSDISKICRGKKQQAKGYKFEYRGKPLNRPPKRKD